MIPQTLVGYLYLFAASLTAGMGWTLGVYFMSKVTSKVDK